MWVFVIMAISPQSYETNSVMIAAGALALALATRRGNRTAASGR
jgi:hypothetical protein